MTRQWIMEIGVDDNDGYRLCAAEMDTKTTDGNKAIDMGNALKGMNIHEVWEMPDTCQMCDDISDRPVKGFSIVLYDSENGSDWDTQIHFNLED